MKRHLLAGFLFAGLTVAALSAQAETVRPMPDEQCRHLATLLAKALGNEPAITIEPFTQIAGMNGQSCRVAWAGSGLSQTSQTRMVDEFFSNFPDWQPDFLFSKDGGTEEIQGFRKGDQLIVMSARWEPRKGACRPKEPIETCGGPPERRRWTVQVDGMISHQP